MQRVFSGIQPTGVPHLGNYLGALINWKKLQDTHTSAIYCVVDLHALTIPQNAKLLRQNSIEMAASLLAIGIDPKKSIVYRQSSVPEHTSLAWLFMCNTPVSWLQRMHQWKTKSKGNPDLGLLAYPVLQAADILLFKATHVPVGEDQMQHLNLCRDIAIKFNGEFGDTFPVPDAILSDGNSKRIMSLRSPTNKMSKSDPVDASRINLTDSPELIARKVAKAMTDSEPSITYDPESRPGVANLLHIYSSLQDISIEEAMTQFSSNTTKHLKDAVMETCVKHLIPIQKEYSLLMKDTDYLNKMLQQGEVAAREIAIETMKDVNSRVGTVIQ